MVSCRIVSFIRQLRATAYHACSTFVTCVDRMSLWLDRTFIDFTALPHMFVSGTAVPAGGYSRERRRSHLPHYRRQLFGAPRSAPSRR